MIVFALRLACLLAPAGFVLNGLASAFAKAAVFEAACSLALLLVALLSTMTVCRAYVSLVGREGTGPAGQGVSPVE